MSRKAYFVAFIDFKQDPPVVVGAGIFGEATPTSQHHTFSLMDHTADDFGKAAQELRDILIKGGEMSIPYMKWCARQVELGQ